MYKRIHWFFNRLALLECIVCLFMLFLILGLAKIAAANTNASAPEHVATTNVTIQDFSFSPTVITVPFATQLTWQNMGNFTHTVSITGVIDSGPIGPGGVFSYTFSLAGAYPYQCLIHPLLMQATIDVTRDSYLPVILR